MGMYADILGEEVKLDNLMAQATRDIRNLEPAQYLTDTGVVEYTRAEVCQLIGRMASYMHPEQYHYGLGQLIAWVSLSDDNYLTFG